MSIYDGTFDRWFKVGVLTLGICICITAAYISHNGVKIGFDEPTRMALSSQNVTIVNTTIQNELLKRVNDLEITNTYVLPVVQELERLTTTD